MIRTSESRREFLRRAGMAGAVSLLGVTGLQTARGAGNGDQGRTATVSVRPQPYDKAFANPLKGFRTDLPSDGGDGRGLDNPLITLARHYIRWNQIESTGTDTVDAIHAFCNPKWEGIEKRNLKIIPRVYLYWPDKYYWPSDLRAGDYGSTRFLDRVGKLIFKLGEAWDSDPRVAYVETGIVGPCGEQWGPTPHFELRKMIGDSHAAAFKNKLCMIRYPWQWPDYDFGVFWDSWGTRKDTARMLEVLESPALRGSWKTRVRGGEISYGFGDPPGNDPNDTMSNSHHANWIECLTRRGHWNHLGWVSYYDWKSPKTTACAQRLQKAFGYRFILEEVTYAAQTLPGKVLRVSFKVRNTGSSPFYYNWPVEVSLLDDRTRKPAWRGIFDHVDIRQWLPGDGWGQFASWNADAARFLTDAGPARYHIPPEAHEVKGSFPLPRDLPRGRYILALAILDPSAMLPACRFASGNYFKGGRHPIGRISLGHGSGSSELHDTVFDDLASDTRSNTARRADQRI